MRFFISFSSRDLPAVRELMSGFRSQNIDFWDYSDEIQSIEAGQSIPERLLKEIKNADYFVPIISTNSIDPEIGKFTHLEVSYALKLGFEKKGKIIPIELQRKGDRQIQYQGEYEKLHDLKHENFELQNVTTYIEVLQAVSNRVKIPFIPFVVALPRLPFWQKFRDEVMTLFHSNSTHVQLMTVLAKFNQYFKDKNYEVSLKEIRFFTASIYYHLPEEKVVYPFIVKAVNELELGLIEEAEASFQEALNHDPHNADALGGMGMINNYLGSYEKAAEYFEKASIHSTDPDQARNERVNRITAILSGRLTQQFTPEEQAFISNINLANLKEDEKAFTLKAKAAVYYHTSQFARAVELYQKLDAEGTLDETGSIAYYYLSVRMAGKPNPQNILIKYIELGKNKNINKDILREYLANFYFDTGAFKKGDALYRNYLLPPHKKSLETMANYALQLYRMNKAQLCNDLCRQATQLEEFSLPRNPAEFYYCGLIQYLSGEETKARYDFERSHNFGVWYRELFG
ncbi:MAG: TIR domain-containing protein [Prolixibacteraceae bacterium]|nr:TIR domain-containing protein [Prolixibacteraceae bacterium]